MPDETGSYAVPSTVNEGMAPPPSELNEGEAFDPHILALLRAFLPK